MARYWSAWGLRKPFNRKGRKGRRGNWRGKSQARATPFEFQILCKDLESARSTTMKLRQRIFRSVLPVILAGMLWGQTRYFPSGVLGEDKKLSTFVEEWYSKHLKALKEPSLYELSQKDKDVEIYRFLWLRSFHHPISVRIEINKDGTSKLTSKEANGAGGYDPGRLVRNKTVVLDANTTSWFLGRLMESDYWNLPTLERKDTVGVDGAQWVIEAVKDGKYHVVDRWSPENGAVRSLGIDMMTKLAKFKLIPKTVY